MERSDFIEWVEKYLLPNSGLLCNAIDLYSARCAILHSYTSKSKLSCEGKAKEILYAWGTGRAEDLQELVKLSGKFSIIALHIEKLIKAYQIAVERFKQHLSNNPQKANIVYERAQKFFSNMPPLKVKK